MSSRSYWLDLFTGKTWDEFLNSGADVTGFRDGRWKTVQEIKPGDYLLCYLTGISRFIGLLEVVSEPFKDNAPIWSDEDFPCRLKVKVVAQLTPETSIPVHDLKNQLSVFEDLKSPHAWTGHFRGSPKKWKKRDGDCVEMAILGAVKNPVSKPFDPRKLAYRPKAIRSKVGPISIPEKENEKTAETISKTEELSHTEIQWCLAKLGGDMGLDIWVARNDRGRECKGRSLGHLPRVIDKLPIQFDEATNRTIELIDILWLDGNAIVAAFEIESTTQIYSGLLRMADLIAMQPNINIPLFIVAPDERREKVFKEVNRATFSRLNPPLNEICRYLSYSSLQEHLSQATPYLAHLKPDFLEVISESCELME